MEMKSGARFLAFSIYAFTDNQMRFSVVKVSSLKSSVIAISVRRFYSYLQQNHMEKFEKYSKIFLSFRYQPKISLSMLIVKSGIIFVRTWSGDVKVI